MTLFYFQSLLCFSHSQLIWTQYPSQHIPLINLTRMTTLLKMSYEQINAPCFSLPGAARDEALFLWLFSSFLLIAPKTRADHRQHERRDDWSSAFPFACDAIKRYIISPIYTVSTDDRRSSSLRCTVSLLSCAELQQIAWRRKRGDWGAGDAADRRGGMAVWFVFYIYYYVHFWTTKAGSSNVYWLNLATPWRVRGFLVCVQALLLLHQRPVHVSCWWELLSNW